MTSATTAAGRTLLRGGRIYTGGGAGPTAMVIDGDRIAWVGTDAGADGWKDRVDVELDLAGRVVAPGFVDAHVHTSKTGFALQSVDLGVATSAVEALELVEHQAGSESGAVLFAHGWDESAWPDGRAFTAAELDAVVGDRAAYIGRVDAHSAVVSTALLEQAPEIAELDGWLGEGLVSRDAHHLARRVVDELRTPEERRAAILATLRRAAEVGITEVHELNAPHIAPYDDAALIAGLRSRHVLPEVVGYWGAELGGDHPGEPVAGFAGDLCVDGSIGSRTAALASPYAGSDSRGHLYIDEAGVCAHVLWCTEHSTQAGFHVIGDRGVETAVNGLRRAAGIVGRDAMVAARHRLEHVEMICPTEIAALAELGVVASVQPAFDAAWGASNGLYARRLGRERSRPMNPFATMQRAGVTLAFGSDSPITPLDPWGGVRAAVRHSNPDERLTLARAFEAHTRGGHRAHGDDESGTLREGAVASLVVWEADAVGTEGLPVPTGPTPPRCVRTVVRGEIAFDAGDLADRCRRA